MLVRARTWISNAICLTIVVLLFCVQRFEVRGSFSLFFFGYWWNSWQPLLKPDLPTDPPLAGHTHKNALSPAAGHRFHPQNHPPKIDAKWVKKDNSNYLYDTYIIAGCIKIISTHWAYKWHVINICYCIFVFVKHMLCFK